MTDSTQLVKNIPTASENRLHEASRISCYVNQHSGDKVADYLDSIGVTAYLETGRTIREYIEPKRFGFLGNTIKLQSNLSSIFRFTVHRKDAIAVMKSLIAIADLHTPGMGTIFSQDLLAYSETPLPVLENNIHVNRMTENGIHFLKDLSYVVCVLTGHEAGEQLAKTALELGVCVPLLTYGTGNDIRDQLGLLRITISPDKEVVHLVMPRQDSESIIKLLIEESKLDQPGRGYIFQTPVTLGHLDTRMKVGKQNHAASIDQIIAAIDTLKMGTDWRKRLETETRRKAVKPFLPDDNCEISVITEEDQIDDLKEICLTMGVSGAVTSKVLEIKSDRHMDERESLVRIEMSVPVSIADQLVDSLLQSGLVESIHLLNLPVFKH
tara:strand:- start:56049 stop:57194 length:1146 start_codon:yes stop_codon:yes gene_type:complete